MDGVGAPYQVIEARRAPIELEAPMRSPPLGGKAGVVGLGEFQPGAIVDRRPAEGPGPRALAVELVLGLVGAVEPAGGDQPVTRDVIERQSVLLAKDEVGPDAEPVEVSLDAFREDVARPRRVRIVEAKDIAAAMAPREQPVE